MKWFFKLIFRLNGWKVVGDNPKSLKKFVMVAAPHTSNWDFIFARAAYFIMDIRVQFTIKKELFFFPLGWFLKLAGGIPIDRKKKGNMVSKMTEYFNDWDEFALLVTPEGTRSYVKEWKKGFYYIAQSANVPIVLGYLDYSEKEAGVGPVIYPTGNYEKDLKKIQDFYRKITPKFPEKGVL